MSFRTCCSDLQGDGDDATIVGGATGNNTDDDDEDCGGGGGGDGDGDGDGVGGGVDVGVPREDRNERGERGDNGDRGVSDGVGDAACNLREDGRRVGPMDEVVGVRSLMEVGGRAVGRVLMASLAAV